MSKKFIFYIFIQVFSLMLLKSTPAIASVEEEIKVMKTNAQNLAVSLEPSVAKCFISFVEKAVEDQEFKRRLKICVETEKVLSNKAINMSRAADLAKCHSLRIKVINDGLEAGKKCETRYESKIDW